MSKDIPSQSRPALNKQTLQQLGLKLGYTLPQQQLEKVNSLNSELPEQSPQERGFAGGYITALRDILKAAFPVLHQFQRDREIRNHLSLTHRLILAVITNKPASLMQIEQQLKEACDLQTIEEALHDLREAYLVEDYGDRPYAVSHDEQFATPRGKVIASLSPASADRVASEILEDFHSEPLASPLEPILIHAPEEQSRQEYNKTAQKHSSDLTREDQQNINDVVGRKEAA